MEKILVFIYDNMADFEITYATHLLGAFGQKQVVTIAYENIGIKSKSGVTYQPDALVKEVLEEDVAGLIITGGWNGEIRPELVDLIQSLNAKKKLLAAICAGPRFLAKAGILENVKYTTSIIDWNDDLERIFGGGNPFNKEGYVFDRVVRDENIITAQGYAFVDFAIEICDYFNLYNTLEEKIAHLNNVTGK